MYVPVTSREFVEKAHTRGADGIKLDLEDSIPAAEKDAARRALPGAIDFLAARTDVLVRINRPWRLAVRDLEVAVRPGVRALALPKVTSGDHLRAIDEVVSELEPAAGLAPGTVGFLAMIETPAALLRAHEIATASPRLVALTLGGEDFATSIGIAPEPDLMEHPARTIVYAARAAGIMPLGLAGTVATHRDTEAFRAVARRSRRIGFLGASAIHPAQVPILNEEFAPPAEEVDRARRLVAAYDAAVAEGVGAIDFEGSMVDEPIVVRARALVEWADAVAARTS